MGLFENLGRKVEKFKQQAEEASAEQASRECADCGELIYTDREDCPECGSERIVTRDEDDSESESDSAD